MEISENLGRTIVTYKGMRYGIPADRKAAHLNYLRTRQRLEDALERRYPYLTFRVWATPWCTDYQDRHPCDWRTQVFAGKVTAGFAFRWPLTAEVKQTLAQINTAAACAQQDGYFYCSRCRAVKAQRELGKAEPGYTLCVDCAYELQHGAG